VSWAIINPRFTPVHLVAEADMIVAGPLEATDNPQEWKLSAATAIKGKPPATVILSLSGCEKDHVEQITQTFRENRAPVVLFSGEKDGRRQTRLHIMGQWLNVQDAKDRWQVLDSAPDMDGTFNGGSDMLIRMARYIVRDSEADVPVSGGVKWTTHVTVGKVPGEVAGLAAVDFAKVGRMHLFVGAAAGDRLFRASKEGTFDDVTAAAKLDTRSRRFTWVDMDGDGLADLLSWDGEKLSVRLAGKDGTFHAANGLSLPLANCLALAPCSTDGRPGVLASLNGAPLLLTADGAKGWTKTELPGGDGDFGRPSACVVADLDNDGFVDVLQPAERGSLLWKGKAGGFEKPRRVAIATGGGTALAAVGDFDQDGLLDIFLAGQEKNTLWENEGKGNFREVLRYSGSPSYKCPVGACGAQAMDLNHDGRTDICLIYEQNDLLYHFNRGFRSFASEAEVRLPGTQTNPGGLRVGQRAIAAADFNGDGSCDLAVLLTNGDLVCCFNEMMGVPGVRLRLAQGMTGPVTVSCWVGDDYSFCSGVVSVPGHSPAAFISTRNPGECRIKYRLPGGTEQVKTVVVEDGPKEVVLGKTP
jgi:hypothetical protein